MTRSKSTNKNLNDADLLKRVVGTYLQEYLGQKMSHHLNALLYGKTGSRRDHRKN
jgi:hypothetical protein